MWRYNWLINIRKIDYLIIILSVLRAFDLNFLFNLFHFVLCWILKAIKLRKWLYIHLSYTLVVFTVLTRKLLIFEVPNFHVLVDFISSLNWLHLLAMLLIASRVRVFFWSLRYSQKIFGFFCFFLKVWKTLVIDFMRWWLYVRKAFLHLICARTELREALIVGALLRETHRIFLGKIWRFIVLVGVLAYALSKIVVKVNGIVHVLKIGIDIMFCDLWFLIVIVLVFMRWIAILNNNLLETTGVAGLGLYLLWGLRLFCLVEV